MTEFLNKRVAIYARFSSQQQREASLEDQVRQCRAFVEARGGRVPQEMVFEDQAISGASLRRPAFERMMDAVNDKQVDVIVTEDLSRISRDIADSASVFKRLEYLKVPLVGVADGIDTSQGHAKMAFTMKSLMSEMYLDDLRYKTMRGLEGRALAGLSTGGLPLGYYSEPVFDSYKKIVGHKVVVEEQGAAVVRRIFGLYLEGMSLATIARRFNIEGVPPPRAHTRHRRKGWVASTIRDILHNESYIGVWTFKKREWRKLPGTNLRRYRPRPEAEIIRRTYEERRIIDPKTWDAVQARLASVRRCYTKTRGKKSVSFGRQNNYPLSGLITCGVCGAPMVISGGSSARYYKCGDAKKRGTCTNHRLLREDTARIRLLDALKARFARPKAVEHLRKKIALELGAAHRQIDTELADHRALLARTEQRIAGLIEILADGDKSDYIRSTLRDLEAQAKAEKAALAGLNETKRKPVVIPSPDVITEKFTVLETLVREEPLQGREALRQLFEDGQLKVVPEETGYVARGRLDLGRLFSLDLREGAQTTKAPLSQGPHRLDTCSSSRCAGRI